MCEITAKVSGVVGTGWVNTSVVDSAVNTAPTQPTDNNTPPAYVPDYTPPSNTQQNLPDGSQISTELPTPPKNKMGGGIGSVFIGIGLIFGIAWASKKYIFPKKQKTNGQKLLK